mgnify:CR=1 FL=1
MKIGIDSPLWSIPSQIASHKGAWAYLWMNQIKSAFKPSHIEVLHKGASWDTFDAIYLEHGMEFDDSRSEMNIIGGAIEQVYEKAKRLLDFKGQLISLDREMPMYGDQLRTKIGRGSTHHEITNEFCDALNAVCKKATSLTQSDLRTGVLCVGDSHSFSRYRPPAMCYRMDGRTLKGALKYGLHKLLPQYGDVQEVIFKLGDIDIRHHVARDRYPERYLKTMLNHYEYQLLSLPVQKITLCYAMPIEDESRKLPKTGYFNGTTFCGSRTKREQYTRIFNEWVMEMHRTHGFGVIKYPEQMYDVSPLEFFQYMEKPQSVHLSRQYYHWDFVNNKPNFNDDYIAPQRTLRKTHGLELFEFLREITDITELEGELQYRDQPELKSVTLESGTIVFRISFPKLRWGQDWIIVRQTVNGQEILTQSTDISRQSQRLRTFSTLIRRVSEALIPLFSSEGKTITEGQIELVDHSLIASTIKQI